MSFWKATAYAITSITSKLVVALLIIVVITLLKEIDFDISPSMMLWEIPPELDQAAFFVTVAINLAVSAQVY